MLVAKVPMRNDAKVYKQIFDSQGSIMMCGEDLLLAATLQSHPGPMNLYRGRSTFVCLKN